MYRIQEIDLGRRAVAELAGRISATEMRRLNALADVERRDLAAIAREWLAANLP